MKTITIRPYLDLFRSPHVPRLMLGALIGRMPTSMTALALVLLIRSTGGSYVTTGLVVAVFAVSAGGAAPLLGRLIDRAGQSKVLISCGIACAAGFAMLGIVGGKGPTALLVTGATLGGAANPPLAPCMRALWSTIAGPARLQLAFALESTVQELVFVIGPLIVVGLVAIASPRAAVVTIGLLALAGTLVFASSPASRAWRGADIPRHWAGPMGAPGIRILLLAMLLLAAAFGTVEVAVPAFAEHVATRSAAGPLFSLWALGSMTGGLLYGSRQWPGAPGRRLAWLLVLVATTLGLLALAGSVPQMASLMLLAGLPIAPAIACVYLLVDGQAPAGTLTEAFTWLSTAFMAGSSGGSALSGVLVEHLGPRSAFLGAFALASGASVVAGLGRRVLLAREVPDTQLEPGTALRSGVGAPVVAEPGATSRAAR